MRLHAFERLGELPAASAAFRVALWPHRARERVPSRPLVKDPRDRADAPDSVAVALEEVVLALGPAQGPAT